ncbi:MAG: amidohydrolase [Saprospiraceae bacterium]|nr:amidohydrolase [Pyrinomonadaceae bacterium]
MHSKRNILLLCIVLLLFSSMNGLAQKRLPIIDMHMHARTAAHYGPPPQPMCAEVKQMPFWDQSKTFGDSLGSQPPACKLLMSPMTDEALFQETLNVMKRYNMIGVLGGYDPGLVAKWVKAAPERFISGLDFRLDKATGTASSAQNAASFKPMSPDDILSLHSSGKLQVFAEITNQYGGISPDDPRMEPYWSLAEKLDIPVGIHLGPGGPGEPYLGNPNYRAWLQSALTLEDVLVRHPKLRVYIMHAGYPFLDDLLALLFTHPQVYVEVSMLANVEPRPAFYRYLRTLVDAGYGNRVMFGSDQMVWPGLIEPAIRSIESAPFLSAKLKRDIFYNNAARFLRLSKSEIARHKQL